MFLEQVYIFKRLKFIYFEKKNFLQKYLQSRSKKEPNKREKIMLTKTKRLAMVLASISN